MTPQSPRAMPDHRFDTAIFLLVLLGGLIIPLAPVLTVAVPGVAAVLLILLLTPIDYRFVGVCLVGACYINVAKTFVSSQYILLLFDGLLFIAVCVTVLNGLTLESTRSEMLRRITSVPSVMFALFTCVCVLGLFNDNVPDLEFGLKGFRKTALTIIGFYVGLLLVRGEEEFDKVWRWIGIAGLPIILYGLKQAVAFSVLDYRMMEATDAHESTFTLIGLRSFSIFSGPFHFAMFCVVVATISLSCLYRKGSRKLPWAVVYLLSFAGTLVSQTRTNLVAFVCASMLFVALVRGGWRRWFLGAILGGIIIVAAVLLGFVVFPSRLDELVGSFGRLEDDGRFLYRFEVYRQIWPAIQERWFLGYGMGSGGDTMVVAPGRVHFAPHNVFLKVLLETGIIGTTLFLTGVLAVFRAAWKMGRLMTTDDRARRVCTLALVVVCVVLINGLVGSAIDAYPVNLLFWFAMGTIQNLWLSQIEPRADGILAASRREANRPATAPFDSAPQSSEGYQSP